MEVKYRTVQKRGETGFVDKQWRRYLDRDSYKKIEIKTRLTLLKTRAPSNRRIVRIVLVPSVEAFKPNTVDEKLARERKRWQRTKALR